MSKQPDGRAGTVAHFEGNGPSVTGVIWIGTRPEPGTAVYLATEIERLQTDLKLWQDQADDVARDLATALGRATQAEKDSRRLDYLMRILPRILVAPAQELTREIIDADMARRGR